jgi:hypothetical protein
MARTVEYPSALFLEDSDMFMKTGTDEGISWSVQGRLSHDKRFYAFVQVGTTKAITHDTYVTEERAEKEALQLKDNLLAEYLGG